MRKDIKIGMLIGLGLVIIGLIAISSWPGGTVEERLKGSANESEPVVKSPFDPVVKPPEKHVVEPDQVSDGADEQVELPSEPDERMTRVAEYVVEESNKPVIEAGPRTHIVAENENLSNIAVLHYGDASKWPLIAEANKHIITNVDRLKPGMRLVIPKPK